MMVERWTFSKALLSGLLFFWESALFLPAQPGVPVQKLDFSGYSWSVRQSDEAAGPQSNYFGGRDLSVILNPDKSITLKIVSREGTWYAGEIYLAKRLGYGTYIFRVETPLSGLDPNVVLGLFTYSPQGAYHHREIDIEFSAWGAPDAAPLGQYVVQPYTEDGNMKSFPLPETDGPATYSFTWLPDRVEFLSWSGHELRPDEGDTSIISSWSFAAADRIPKPGSEVVHLNFYLANGAIPPAGKGLTEVTIRSFEFIPAKK